MSVCDFVVGKVNCVKKVFNMEILSGEESHDEPMCKSEMTVIFCEMKNYEKKD